MKFTSDDMEYVAGILKFTERQIELNTGHAVKLSMIRRVDIQAGQIDPKDVLDVIIEAVGTSIHNLQNGGRKKELVMIRQLSCLLLRRHFSTLTYKDIGQMFRHDHTTVLYNIRKANDMLDTQEETFLRLYARASNAVDNFLNQPAIHE